MFDHSGQTDGKGRTRLIMVAAAVLVALGFVALVLWSSMGPSASQVEQPRQVGLPNATHAGDPEFDKYHQFVVLNDKKFFTQANMLGQSQAVMTGKINNFTDRTITGIELRGNVIGRDGTVKATALASPVPKVHSEIPPKQSVSFQVVVDGTPSRDELYDMTIEVEGLVFAEQSPASNTSSKP